MSTETTINMSTVTLMYPDGTIKLMVPTDVPLGELMPDFLDVTHLPDHDGWEIGPVAGDRYRDEAKTLAELGVGDGTVLVLHEAGDTPVAHHDEPPREGAESRRASAQPATCERPLRERTVNTLPQRLSRVARYRTAADYAAADRAELEKIIQSTGFFRAKTTSLIGLGQALCGRFGGEVPPRLEDLVTLPGVGRKTANVVLGNAFGIPGITVDTHLARLARRFGWTTQVDPEKIEPEVGSLFPKSEWTLLSHRLIWHGRRVCHSRKPACGACGVARLCPSFG